MGTRRGGFAHNLSHGGLSAYTYTFLSPHFKRESAENCERFSSSAKRFKRSCALLGYSIETFVRRIGPISSGHSPAGGPLLLLQTHTTLLMQWCSYDNLLLLPTLSSVVGTRRGLFPSRKEGGERVFWACAYAAAEEEEEEEGGMSLLKWLEGR